jgi:hypothetical protein
MIARVEYQVGRNFARCAISPGVDHQHAIEPHARAIIHTHRQTIGAGFKEQQACPTG